MTLLLELWDPVRDFIAGGGDVLWIVAAVLCLMWSLMIERYWYLYSVFPLVRKRIVARWMERTDTSSWYAHRIRDAWICEAAEQLNARVSMIKTLVAICPLIGLLGTVTGMIAVFEIMAVQGTGNPRLMASGISMATIPTMAGMVAALSGLFFSSNIEYRIRMARDSLIDSLPYC
jgi:biopolymer transport protein ExbB